MASVDVRASEGLRSCASENGRLSRYGSSSGYNPPTGDRSFAADYKAVSLSHLTGTYCGRSDVPKGIPADGPESPCTPLCVCVSTQYDRTDCQPAVATYIPAQLIYLCCAVSDVDSIGATTPRLHGQAERGLSIVRHTGPAPPNVNV